MDRHRMQTQEPDGGNSDADGSADISEEQLAIALRAAGVSVDDVRRYLHTDESSPEDLL